ncbi:NADP-dependent oxidoreductase domain-containing protein [Lipomyces kononenkoae]|uniref:NADP-dependent oxidoreductase domain-containing protein n=1 Tax=Lipomyces kononenkoae TaxID=34357 RepID=A0ACC3SR46_LIPKO
MVSSTFLTLASGYQMPQVGFGLWKVPRETTAETVYNAIQLGYRLFDGAYDYQNEKEAGEGIRKAISDGLVTREEIFITTKLWNNYHRKEHAIKMAKTQNDTWGLGYIDLYLIHFPIALKFIEPSDLEFPAWWIDSARSDVAVDKVPIAETWAAMEAVVDIGIARSIGVSNFSAQLIYDIMTYARHPISALQIEHHPYLVQSELVKLAQENNIAVTAYSSFGPQSFLELPPDFSGKAQAVSPLLDNERITFIASKYRKTPAQILLRWATQRGIAVIPKSNSQSRLTQNLEVTDFDLTREDVKAISDLDCGLRFNDPGEYLVTHPLRIFT